jgi:heterodisulfide reductase subunit C1
MINNIFELLKQDIRFQEGLKSCINCGTCTAICPAAEFYDYDPRIIANTVQSRNDGEILQLLKSDTIWYCGECLSCKTRCPKNNTPGYIIQSLRYLSHKLGYFAESEKGRQSLILKRSIGEHILKYGYCVYIDEIDTERFPEQGPVWDWMTQNKLKVLERLGANYQKEGAGALRKIPDESLSDLRKIFEATGAMDAFDQIEKLAGNEDASDSEPEENYTKKL